MQSGSLEVFLWARRLEEGNLDAKLASNLAQQGKVKPKFDQTWFRELASCEQLDVRWLVKLENSKNHCKTTLFFEGPGWPKMGPRGLQELSCRILSLCVAPFWAHLGLSWAPLGPSWGVEEGILRQFLGLGGLRWA